MGCFLQVISHDFRGSQGLVDPVERSEEIVMARSLTL
jgi:hypothetical protein